MTQRNRTIQLIHVARRELNLDEDTYRSLIEQTTGKESLKELTIPQLTAVLDRMKASGFKVRTKRPQDVALASDDQSKKIRALWLHLHTHGEVKNPSERALLAYVERQTHVSALHFLSSTNASKVIERLKKWCERKDIPLFDA